MRGRWEGGELKAKRDSGGGNRSTERDTRGILGRHEERFWGNPIVQGRICN